MSRSTVSKSRADKAKDKDRDSKGSSSAQAPLVNTDVIPGRLTEHEWNLILDHEHGEEFMVDLVTDIVDSAVNIIYDNYIQKQLYPYVVDKSRELFLYIIEWQFLARDEGETDPAEDETWAEEDEPLPGVPDAWAQGSVPYQPLPPVSPDVSEHDTELTSVSRISNPEILEDPPSTLNETELMEEEEMTETGMSSKEMTEVEDAEVWEEDETEHSNNNNQPIIEEKQEPLQPRKPKYRPYRGPVKSAGVRSINKSLEETEKELIEAETRRRGGGIRPVKTFTLDYMPSSCCNIVKVQTGRPPGSKEATYDDIGNVVAVVKLDPEKLPSHRVRTKFAVTDPAVEATHVRLQSMRALGRPRTNPSRNQIQRRNTQLETAGTKATPSRINEVAASYSTIRSRGGKDGGRTPLPQTMIESMELSPGVTVREGNRLKQGPILALRNGDVTSGKIRPLRPLVTVDNKGVPLSVADFIGARTPSLRPLSANDPIPPIVPKHGTSRENAVES